MDDLGPHVAAQDTLADHLDALEFQRSSDVRGRLEAAIELEHAAEAGDLPTLAMRARLVRADMLHRSGHATAGASVAMEVNAWARRNYAQALLARSHLVLSSIHEGIGDAPAALEHALRAIELTDETTTTRDRGDFILRLADAFALDGSLPAARERYREAQRLFASIPDAERELNALANRAHAESVAGDPQQAWKWAQQMQRVARRNGFELNAEFSVTLARAMLSAGRHDEAVTVLEHAIAMLAVAGDVQAATPATVWLTLAEAHRRGGRLGDAQVALDRCSAICEDRNLVSVGVDALAEQAEVQAALGRFDAAFETQKTYHQRWVRLASSRREAAVQTRQVMFETAEARRAAEQYWRQARTDQLSALPNRRHLDEELIQRLSEVATAGAEIVVAIIDADHFKRINDTMSHAVGDRVIYGLSRVLESSLGRREPGAETPPALIGRLGGEEFLAVVPVTDPLAPEVVLEGIRAAVAEHDWSGVAPSLGLTVSIGATRARPEDSPSDVLRRADAQLYEAKRAGRNRVSLDRPLRGGVAKRSGRTGGGRRKGEAA